MDSSNSLVKYNSLDINSDQKDFLFNNRRYKIDNNIEKIENQNKNKNNMNNTFNDF